MSNNTVSSGISFLLFFTAAFAVLLGFYWVGSSIDQRRIDDCLAGAQEKYSADWEGECARLERGEGCALPAYIADGLKQERISANQICVDRF